MKQNKLYGMMILMVGIMLAFGFTACDNGTTGGGGSSTTRDSVTYTGTAYAGTTNETTYELKIVDDVARRF
jgi:hypothetical protein